MTGGLRETIARAGIEGYTGTSPWPHGVDEAWLRVADAVLAVLPPLVPEAARPPRPGRCGMSGGNSSKVRLTVRFDGLNGERVHEITEGGFWRYAVDPRDRPERLIVRPGPAPSDRYEYPLANVVSVHMDPVGAKR